MGAGATSVHGSMSAGLNGGAGARMQGGLRHFMDPNYYMPGYPLNPPVFRAGLAWHFYK